MEIPEGILTRLGFVELFELHELLLELSPEDFKKLLREELLHRGNKAARIADLERRLQEAEKPDVPIPDKLAPSLVPEEELGNQTTAKPSKKKRVLSPEGRARISEASKKRWAKERRKRRAGR